MSHLTMQITDLSYPPIHVPSSPFANPPPPPLFPPTNPSTLFAYHSPPPDPPWWTRSPYNPMYRPFGCFTTAQQTTYNNSSNRATARLQPSPPPYFPTKEEIRSAKARAAWVADQQAIPRMEPGPRFPANLMRGGRDAQQGRIYEERKRREAEEREREAEHELRRKNGGSGGIVMGALRRQFSSMSGSKGSDGGSDGAAVFPRQGARAKLQRYLAPKVQTAADLLLTLLLIVVSMWILGWLAPDSAEPVLEAGDGEAGADAAPEIAYFLVENYRSWCVVA